MATPELFREWGESLGEWEGRQYHSFPSLASMAQPGVEERLRELGFGYRARLTKLNVYHF